ncbi:MAG: ROK family transcriptional regulator [Chloroflexota bacterium]
MKAQSTTADPALMRELNKSILLNLIRRQGSISRADLAKETRLSRSTVSSIIDALLAEGLVQESGAGESKGGRRPILVNFNYRAGSVIGVDLGATHILVVVTDLGANVRAQAVKEEFSISDGPEAALEEVSRLVSQALRAAGVSLDRMMGLGIGVPGPLNYSAGMVIAPPIMPGWDGIPLRARLESQYKIPVYLDNDANLGALAEKWHGAGRGRDNLAYIKVGTGIGCGLIFDGEIYRGETGSAGEIGHIMVDEAGPPCKCGSYGCLESMAGGPAIAQRAEQAIRAGQRTALQRLARNHGLTAKDVADAAAAGDELSQQLYREAGRLIGVAIADLINLLNPGMVVIGGGVAAAGELLLGPIRQTVQSRALRASVNSTQIVQAQLGREVTAIGAATLVLQEAFRSPDLTIQMQL